MKLSIKSTPIGKPQDPQGANITYGWSAVDITPQRLVEHITQGKPFAVAHYQNNHRKNNHFLVSDLIALDVDGVEGRPLNAAEWQQLLNDPFITKNAFAVIQSFSSKPDAYKARILFHLDQPISDPKLYRQLVAHVMAHYCPWADPAAKDGARSFYGGQPGRQADFQALENRLEIGPMLAHIQEQQAQRQARQAAPSSPPTSASANPLQHQAYVQKALDNALYECNHTPQGQGNATLFRVACGLFGLVKGGYLTQGEVESLLYSTDVARRRSSAETRGVLDSAWNTAQPRQITAQKPPKPQTTFSLWQATFGRGGETTIQTEEARLLDAEATATDGQAVMSAEEKLLQRYFPVGYHYQEVTSQYLNESVNTVVAPITFVKSPIGSGKTEWLKDMLRGPLAGKSVLCVTHRRSLSRNQAKRMGLAHYEEVNFFAELPVAMVITLDSLYKVTLRQGTLPQFDVILIDESEQVIRHLAGSTFRNHKPQGAPPAKTAYNLLIGLLLQSEYAIALDADMDELTHAFLARACPDKAAHSIVNTYRRERPLMELYASAEEARARFLAHLSSKAPGELLAVACDSANDARALAHQAQELGLQGLCITGEESEYASTQAIFKDFDAALVGLDFFIYSSAIGTGVDIQYPVHTVYGLFSNKSIIPSDQLQMLGRCRNVQQTIVGSNSILGTRCSAPDVIYDLYLKDVRELAKLGIEMTWLPQGTLSPDHAEFLSLISGIEADYNRSMNDNRLEFIARAWPRYRVKIDGERIATEAVKIAAKEAKKATKEAKKETILAADPVSDEEYRRHIKQNKGADPEMKAGNTKWKIQEVYHTEEVTAELYDDWLDNGPTKLLNFMLLQSDLTAALIFDQDQVDRPMDIHHLAVMSPKIQIIQKLIAAIFPDQLHSNYISLEEVDGKLQTFDTLWAEAGGNGEQLLGRKLGQVPKTSIGKFRALLDLFGLKFIQQWYDGSYWYQLQHLEKMQAYMDQFIRYEATKGDPQKFSLYIHQKKSGSQIPEAAFKRRKQPPVQNSTYSQQKLPWGALAAVLSDCSGASKGDFSASHAPEGAIPESSGGTNGVGVEDFPTHGYPHGAAEPPDSLGSQKFSLYIHQKISGADFSTDPPE